jgi:hypothetical protein
MRTVNDLVGDILSLKKTDLDLLAEALAVFDIRKAEQFKFLLDVRVREEDARRLNDWNAIGSKLLAKAVEEERAKVTA